MTTLTRRAAGLAALGLLATLMSTTDGRADTASADGKAEGTLTVNGKTVNVAYAYARSMPGFFDKNSRDDRGAGRAQGLHLHRPGAATEPSALLSSGS